MHACMVLFFSIYFLFSMQSTRRNNGACGGWGIGEVSLDRLEFRRLEINFDPRPNRLQLDSFSCGLYLDRERAVIKNNSRAS